MYGEYIEIEDAQIGEKVPYQITVDYEYGSSFREDAELLTTDFHALEDDLCDALIDTDYPNNIEGAKHRDVAQAISKAIQDNWDAPVPPVFTGLSITIERQEEAHYFTHSGCDLCADNLGADVYPVIFYNDAKLINQGEYIDGEICGDCLCKYHNGE